MSTSTFSYQAILESSDLTRRVHDATERLSGREQWQLFIGSLVANDVIMLAAAYALSYWIRFHLSLPIFKLDAVPSVRTYSLTVLFLIPLWVAASFVYDLYDKGNLLGGAREYSRVFHVSILGLIALLMVDFLWADVLLARGWLLMGWFFSFLFVAGGRFWLRRVVYALRKRGYFTANTLVIGANEEGFALVQQLSEWQTSGLNILGFIDDELAVGEPATDDYVNLGNVNQLNQIIKQHRVKELILATGAIDHETMISVFKQYGTGTDVNLRLSSGLFGIVTNGLEVVQMAFVPLIRVNKMRFSGIERLAKFCLDYAIAVPVVLVGLLLYPFIALAIKLDSPGKVIYRRRVMGVNGRQFDAFKFRTMYENGDAILEENSELKKEFEQNQKLKEDPRVTRVGKFMRKYSLDEFPQLINVFKRDMSLVGPRMITPAEMERFGKWGTNLLTVMPGLTGLWQVSGRSDTTYNERVQLDMYYIRNWTIWSDLYLLWMTIPAVIKKRGAY
jgi:exopolysaccharide biosynthesis polyprenyl glycosylphosphotransferase